MIGLVMCGGKGTRMNLPQEKLLLKYKNPIIQHVINALQESGCFSKIIGATSPNAPKTSKFLKSLGISTIQTEGNGYVNDLNQILHNFDEHVFVISGDMPLLDAKIIKKIVQLVDTKNMWTTVVLSKNFLDSLHVKTEYLVIYNNNEYSYSGISIVNPIRISGMKPVEESYVILDDKRIALNLNTKQDYDLLGTT
ncbi:NTP transferase domain-containing protein [Candidatus Pacearchaeota archaeon]|nr:NTP transferase domain-containing protein [Candidatus Pacearchaeota archaeon]